jgi:hypothetical protein
MANRTIQIYGQGFGSTPAEIVVTANGNTVFSGTIPTTNDPLPVLPNIEYSTQEIFEFTVDPSFSGQLPMTCQVTNGTVIFAQVEMNYSFIRNPVYTQEQAQFISNPTTTWAQRVELYVPRANPALTQQQIDILLDPAVSDLDKNKIVWTHNLATIISSGDNTFVRLNSPDPRSNVAIDGIAQNPDRIGLAGTWWWVINSGSTLSYNLGVTAEAA